MTTSHLKLAVIGCGRIAGHHLRSARATNGIELVAICDLLEERARAYGLEFGIPYYLNYHDMLTAHPDIDVVAVITPSGMHLEHALDIVDLYCKHVIVEKPLVLRSEHVDRLIGAAEAKGRRVFPVFQNRHNLAVQRVLRGLRQGELGDLRIASVRVRWCRPQRYYDLAPWRGTWAMDGGAMTNQGIHHVDLLRLMGGEVDSVAAHRATFGANIEVEDTIVASLRFKSGAIGSLEITTAARPDDFEASISFVCSAGLAQVGGIAVNELQIFTPDPSACVINSEDFSGNVYGNGHERLYEEVVADLHYGIPYSVDAADARATVRLLNALYVASETGKWVNVDSAPDSAFLGRESEELASLYRTPAHFA